VTDAGDGVGGSSPDDTPSDGVVGTSLARRPTPPRTSPTSPPGAHRLGHRHRAALLVAFLERTFVLAHFIGDGTSMSTPPAPQIRQRDDRRVHRSSVSTVSRGVVSTVGFVSGSV
jgi:hypothetical protein